MLVRTLDLNGKKYKVLYFPTHTAVFVKIGKKWSGGVTAAEAQLVLDVLQAS